MNNDAEVETENPNLLIPAYDDRPYVRQQLIKELLFIYESNTEDLISAAERIEQYIYSK